MKQQAGFTLIEALITGIISTGFAGVILSLFYMNNNQIIDGIGRLHLSQKYSIVSDQIKQTARVAAYTWNDSILPIPPSMTMPDSSHIVCFFREDYVRIGCYYTAMAYNETPGVDIYRLMEWKNGALVSFNTGDNGPTHFIHPKNVSDNSFQFLPRHEGIEFHFFPVQMENGKRFTLKAHRETVLLRNAVH